MPLENTGNTEPCPTPSVISSESCFIDPIILVLDLDLPIALRKGVRSCTQHPLRNFISYHRLNPFFKTSTTNLSIVSIHKTT